MSQFATNNIAATLAMGAATTFISGVVDFNVPEAIMNVTKYTVAGSDGWKRAAGHGRELGELTFTLPYSAAAYKPLWLQYSAGQTIGGAYAEQAPVDFFADLGPVTWTFKGLITRLKGPPNGALDENAMIEVAVTPDGGFAPTGLPT